MPGDLHWQSQPHRTAPLLYPHSPLADEDYYRSECSPLLMHVICRHLITFAAALQNLIEMALNPRSLLWLMRLTSRRPPPVSALWPLNYIRYTISNRAAVSRGLLIGSASRTHPPP